MIAAPAAAPATALTHLIAGQTGAHERQLARFDDTQWQHYLDLLSALFVLVVHRRFRPGDPAAIIRYVATVRERFDPAGTGIEPTTAETLLYAALGQHDTLPATADTIAAQTMLVVALVNDEGLSPAGLANLINDTNELIALHAELAEREQPPDPADPAPAEEADLPTPDTTAADARPDQQ
ncbi:hypothetical protein [Micromonospora sp. NBC_01813]|uniref:hypothetical protein n=1 Tax=Micromonospora sp. NBC_01813 TaxID=2975988 RepID=UPI002DD7CC10|nr:hypothetical protein [Micromonospora sp. NBC_01813]WSA09747.1 hypothetical protein OG958_02720 [Micromonospora sp. NBC_01813]